MSNTEREITKLEDFFNTDYVDSASYDNLRKIGSITDGLKNSSRKIIHTMIDKNIKEKTKVARLASTIAEHTEYLHGELGLAGVMVNLAQNFVGANNIPYIKRDGNFGTRHKPAAAAPRYIKTRKEDYLDKLYMKEDYPVLIEQQFEGIKIEPRYFVPILPMLLVNGSEGISSGFAQKILPRNPKTIVSELNKVLKGTKKLENVKLGSPYWEGFQGRVEEDAETKGKWLVYGNLIRENKNSIKITEVPIGFTLDKYVEVLDALEDKNVIQNYQDKSDTKKDLYNFNLKVRRDFSDKHNDQKLYEKLKLVKSMSENYTCIDQNNRIKVYNSAEEIFIDYYNLRLDYYNKRKEYLLGKYKRDLDFLNSRYVFVKGVVDGKILVNNKTKSNIVGQLDKIDKIIKEEDSYDYLLRMPIYSLTKEKLDEIKKKIKDTKELITTLKNKKSEEMWLEDLENVKAYLN
jgi:DNA topoisomerase-2